jgi:predicted DNA-binding protein (MmcQ/YjbR family)
MTLDDFRSFCAELPESRETFPFDDETLVIKVKGKMYALTNVNARELKINLKCDPVLALDLRSAYPGRILPGWHMNHEHWNTVTADGEVPDDKLCWMIRHSYDLVVDKLPKRDSLSLKPGKKGGGPRDAPDRRR